jgi:hypothetical protein
MGASTLHKATIRPFNHCMEYRVPTRRQRERILRSILSDKSAPVYQVCDVVGWLMGEGRKDEYEQVLGQIDASGVFKPPAKGHA